MYSNEFSEGCRRCRRREGGGMILGIRRDDIVNLHSVYGGTFPGIRRDGGGMTEGFRRDAERNCAEY